MSGMKEQIAQHSYRGIPARPPAYTQAATRERLPASPHGVGHAAGLHGEDQPYQSGDYDVRHTAYGTLDDDMEDEEDDFSPTRPPRSAIRYRATMTDDQQPPVRQAVTPTKGQAVTIYRAHRPPQQGRPRPPARGHPTKPSQQRPSRRLHWMVFVGLFMFTMLAGWVLLTMLAQWWQVTQDDWHYGRPRTFQTDAVVGHGDSVSHPSHFIAINVNRHVEIIEFQGGDPSKARVYVGPTLIGPGQDLAVVTLSFKDVNGDGNLDMMVNIQESHFVFLNDHGQFRPAKPGEAVSM